MSTRARIARALAALAGIICIPVGIYVVWAQHNGPLESVTTVECHYAGRGQSCTGQWQDSSGEPQVVYIVSAGEPRVGDTETMRIHGGKAYSTSPGTPLMLIGGGAVLLGGAGYSVLAGRRRDAARLQRESDST